MTTSVKMRGDLARRLRVDGAVEGDDAAEGADGIAAERPGVGLGERLPSATPQGLACLMMATAGEFVELRHQLEGGVGVGEVVVGELLALVLHGGGHAGRALAADVEGGALVRVLAVAQRLRELAAERRARRGARSPSSLANQR